jgi:NTE family protein
MFDVDLGVRLVDAVRASCAVLGLFSSVSIDGRRYADGGLSSPSNADLAAAYGVVIVLGALRPNPYLQRLLDAEIASLGDVTVRVIMADEASLSAIGPDLLSTRTTRAALNAGRAQAAQESDPLRSIWRAG